MSTKAQDIKHEKILRALSKQPENKRCINCETLGPGYVVTDLRIFVCTTCAGVHRNFGHRVKSISMATFSPNEVKAMQEGGNLVAEATYLARWTSRDQPKPTDRHESNISRWIRAVYEDKAFFSSMSEVSHEEQASHARHEHSHGSVSSHNSPGIAASAAPATSAAEPSLIDLGDDPPAPAAAAAPAAGGGGWSAFEEPAAAAVTADAGGWASFDTAPAAAPPSAAADGGWAAFEDAPQRSEPEPGGFSADGWADFSSPGKDAAAGAQQQSAPSGRKELPSDLFSEPAAQAFPSFGGGPGFSAAAPGGYYGAGPAYGGPPPGHAPPFGVPHSGPAGMPPYGMPPGMPPYGARPPARDPAGGAFMPVYGNPAVPSYGGPQAPTGYGPPASAAAGGGFYGTNPMASGGLPNSSGAGNPFGGPMAAGPGGSTAPSGNPFALVSQEGPKGSSGGPDAFNDLLPTLGASLPPAGSKAAPPPSAAAFPQANLGGAPRPAASPSDPFSAFAGQAQAGSSLGSQAQPAGSWGASDPFGQQAQAGMAHAPAASGPPSDPFSSIPPAQASQGFGMASGFGAGAGMVGSHQPLSAPSNSGNPFA